MWFLKIRDGEPELISWPELVPWVPQQKKGGRKKGG
jgi:hypothetical protein